jgi:hypothetical protein
MVVRTREPSSAELYLSFSRDAVGVESNATRISPSTRSGFTEIMARTAVSTEFP